MDAFSITDRLESTTPIRNPEPQNSASGDAQSRQKKREAPKAEPVDESPDSDGETDTHQLDEVV
jgi:hypothetical protein